MHGNTVKSDSHKTRLFEDILSEVKSFWQILKAENINPGGVHLEVTGDNVTECIGGISGVTESGIGLNYTTNCDPRLNAAQAVELAFEVGKIISS
jgi:3-deoxy-7-phosphoheptulonate synthase